MGDDFIFCKNLVGSFVEKHLKGDFSALKKFDFTTLKGNKLFGCDGRAFDSDDTNLARAIYVLLWGDKFPDLSLSNIGTGKKYRGDTLNTFSTVFGRYSPDRHTCKGLLNNGSPEEVRLVAEKFYSNSHTLGNLIVLPNIAETNASRARTLNTYRGTVYKDYFDLFLIHLADCLDNRSAADRHLSALIEQNGFFFSRLNDNGGLAYLRDICYLEDYFIGDKPAPVFSPHLRCPRKSGRSQAEKTFYTGHIKNYASTVEIIINNRADKMIARLVALI